MPSPTSLPPAVVPTAHPTVTPELVPERRGAVAFLSHIRRDADWIVPRLFRVFAFWGNAEIDLTHALLGTGTTEIEIRCIMANVEITVPPDVRLQCEADAVMGSAEVQRKVASTTSPDAPLVRITGTTLMGSIEVRVIDPNAPSFMEKLRRRITKKAQRG